MDNSNSYRFSLLFRFEIYNQWIEVKYASFKINHILLKN